MNRKNPGSLFFAVIHMVLLFFCQAAYPELQKAQEMSAGIMSRSGGQTVQGKIYVSGEKVRNEVEGNVIIIRPDKNVSWILMPSEKMYMEQPIDRKAVPRTSKAAEGELERVSLGPDTVDGRSVEKFKVVYTEGGSRKEMYQWVTKEEFPIKMEAVDGSWSVEYKNLSMAPQPADLFEVPAGYQKFSMPITSGGVPSLEDLMSQMEE